MKHLFTRLAQNHNLGARSYRGPKIGFVVRVTNAEKAVLDTLRASQGELPLERLSDLANAFEAIRGIIPAVQEAAANHTDARQGEIALIGLANHAYNLLLAGIGHLAGGNAHAWSACVRGLYEVYGAVTYLTENPARAPALLDQGVSAGKLRSAAVRKRPGFKQDFEKLDSLVHPGPWSLNAGFRVADLEKRTADWFMGPQDLALREALVGASVLVETANLIAEGLIELLTKHADIVRTGKKVLERG
jgi:hypothetical protein